MRESISTLSMNSSKLDADTRTARTSGRLVHVRDANPVLEDRDGPRVLGLEPLQSSCLLPEERGELVEAGLCRGELGLERGNARLRRVDGRLRVLELGDDRREL